MAARKDLNRRLKALTDDPPETEVRANSLCGICKKDWGKSGPACGLCKLEGIINGYRGKLYAFKRQGNAHTQGAVRSCMLARVLGMCTCMLHLRPFHIVDDAHYPSVIV